MSIYKVSGFLQTLFMQKAMLVTKDQNIWLKPTILVTGTARAVTKAGKLSPKMNIGVLKIFISPEEPSTAGNDNRIKMV